MNCDAILNTAVVRWSEDDEAYIAMSPLVDYICGAGSTEDEAIQSFQLHVNAHYEAYIQGRHAANARPGRPRKDKKVPLRAEVRPETKREIAAMAKRLGISQGEAVEYCYMLAQKNGKPSFTGVGKKLSQPDGKRTSTSRKAN